MRYLITGGAGFIGHHVVQYLLKNTEHEILLIDRLDVSGNLHRLSEIGCNKCYRYRVNFIYHDLKSPINDLISNKIGNVDVILHLAAATHVDRSIYDPMSFVMDNIVATVNLLDYARSVDNLKTFLYFSTDEVFGPAPEGVKYKEWDRYHSGNPYAASKAGAEEMCIAYQNTYGLRVIITHTMNVIGERQHPEKFLPMCISKALKGEAVTIHANKEKTKAGSRFYIHAKDVADAVFFVLDHGEIGEKYNIVGAVELDNLELALKVSESACVPLQYELVDFHSSRPGHDLRYALDGERMKSMGWTPPQTIDERIDQTVKWTINHQQWLM